MKRLEIILIKCTMIYYNCLLSLRLREYLHFFQLRMELKIKARSLPAVDST